MSKAGSILVGIIGSTALCLGIGYFGSIKAENDQKMADALFGQNAVPAITQAYTPAPVQTAIPESAPESAPEIQYSAPTLESIAGEQSLEQENASDKCRYYNSATTDFTAKLISQLFYGCK